MSCFNATSKLRRGVARFGGGVPLKKRYGLKQHIQSTPHVRDIQGTNQSCELHANT